LQSFAVLMMTAAALGDRLGRRRLFSAGLALFAAASAVCALAPDVNWLIAGRAVQGAGAAFVMPLGLALLSAAFPPERRGAAMAIFSSVTGFSVLCGQRRGRRRAGARRAARRCLRRLRTARPRADAPPRAVRLARVLGRQRGGLLWSAALLGTLFLIAQFLQTALG
jgi:hypothetical protein